MKNLVLIMGLIFVMVITVGCNEISSSTGAIKGYTKAQISSYQKNNLPDADVTASAYHAGIGGGGAEKSDSSGYYKIGNLRPDNYYLSAKGSLNGQIYTGEVPVVPVSAGASTDADIITSSKSKSPTIKRCKPNSPC